MELNFDKQLFRASAMGLLMTNNKKGDAMGETCKTYLKELFREVKYGIRKEFTNKYVEKGLAVEDAAIALYSSYYDDFYHKNEEWFRNDFVSGTPDIVSDEYVIDIKSSWNLFTLPFKDEPINKGYFYQLQTYMWLTGLKKAKLVYVLIDTPAQLVEDEKRRAAWKLGTLDGIDDNYLQLCAEIDASHDFSRIPINERIVEFEIDYSEEVIEQIKKRVIEARNYLNELNG